ncbi:hypothetical protein N7533_009133 [Penicillium manginii]|uniref:uncharacterized protein n=1 Tax=Penicillium manginii TaxID=203109 RepID=UPI0025494B80|nr:uncharacterized protein N7533_009133 [Penicillium manginii]KAJ5744263.1 hypothetical protein N7533_009133 [Penicillium manginii]
MAVANHGASVPDLIAIGSEQENVDEWRKKMQYRSKFTDTPGEISPYAVPTSRLGSNHDVSPRASKLPSASSIEKLSDSPGGGFIVKLTDPEGFPVNLMYGQAPAEKGEYPEKLTINYEKDKPRIRKFQRFEPGPAAVHKLGHFGLCTQDFEKMVDFYTTTFNIVPTDFLYVEKEGKKLNVAMFAHIDRGADYVDHHSFFISTNATTHVHHCSFEVHDFDTQKLGHQWLANKKYKSVWGVGRHILGSQIFDYWWDTTGNMIEHYADGDLVNNQTPIGYGPAGDESLAVWGPEVPAWFLK